MRRLAALLALAPALGAAAAASAADPKIVQRLRGSVEERLDRLHWPPESIDLEGLIPEVAARLDAGASEAELQRWLRGEIQRRWYGFAPIEPRVQVAHRYQLPFDRRVHWIAIPQGSPEQPGGGPSPYSIDFAMPQGTKVLAARSGTVARVVDAFAKCGAPKRRAYAANRVIVLHDDGSFALYSHLRPGIPVAPGRFVDVGDTLGYSGCTGSAVTPRLHFQISAFVSKARAASLALRFQDGSPEGYLPRVWSLYQNRPPATADLLVSVRGNALFSGRPFPLDRLAPTELRVEVSSGSVQNIDVTRDPRTRYVALTPWSLAVDGAGRVVFRAGSGEWAALPDPVERSFAIVTVLFHDQDGRQGFFDAWFEPKQAGGQKAVQTRSK